MDGRREGIGITAAILLAALVGGCATMSSLGEYRFQGKTLSCRLRPPPEPRVLADYAFRIDRSDPVGSVFRVGTGLVKAAEVQQAQRRMERALAAVNLPEEIRQSTLDEFSEALGCDPRGGGESDFVVELDIREYGIDAQSWNAAAQFRVDLVVVLLHGYDRRPIWRARVREDTPITPALLGLPVAAGNIVSAVTLSTLSEADIARGLSRLAMSVASRSAARVGRDFHRTTRAFPR